MHTRSQTRNLHNQQQQAPPAVVEHFNLEDPLENPPPPPPPPMDDQRTMAQLLEAPTEGYEDAIVVPEINANFELKHGLINLVQNKQFLRNMTKEDPMSQSIFQQDHFYDEVPESPEYVDSLNSARGALLDKMPRDCLRIIESKSKPVVAKVSASTSTPGISFEVVELKEMVNALLLDKKNQSPAPTPVKAVEGKLCLLAEPPANFNQGKHGYRAHILNQFGPAPPGFPPVQKQSYAKIKETIRIVTTKKQREFNHASSFTHPRVHQGQVYRPQVVQPPAYQAPAYQAPAPQIQGVSKEDFHSYVKANDAVMRNMQTQGQNMQNQLNNLATSNQRLESMLGNFIKMNTASTSKNLPSNTVTNPKEDLKGITTRSGIAYKGLTILITSSSPKVMEHDTEVSKDTMHPTNNGSTEDVHLQLSLLSIMNQSLSLQIVTPLDGAWTEYVSEGVTSS
ncbi:hypothetical protein Tco_1096141 [Tanacetum coccineum]